MQIRLQNRLGRTSLQGQVIKLMPGNPKAYILAKITDPDAIGTCANSVPNGYWGLVNLTNTHAPPTRIVTDDTTERTTDYTIICNKATAINVYLLSAIGSNRVLEIANIGVGNITVITSGDPSDPSNLDTIDGESSVSLVRWDTLHIKDYAVNRWKIL